jgi:hypothetical protein
MGRTGVLPARPLLEDKGDIMMATAKYGKGTVVAVVDPWLYNECTDGPKKQPVQDNYAAREEFVRRLLKQQQHGSGTPRSDRDWHAPRRGHLLKELYEDLPNG